MEKIDIEEIQAKIARKYMYYSWDYFIKKEQDLEMKMKLVNEFATEAINQAVHLTLEEAAKKAKLHYNPFTYLHSVDKSSILSLEEEIVKTIAK